MTNLERERLLFICLNGFSRYELRYIAKRHGIRRGRNKADTILNLVVNHSMWLNKYYFVIGIDENPYTVRRI